MRTHEDWPQDFDPESEEALRVAVRLAFSVLLDAPFPAEFPTSEPAVCKHLAQYRRWYEEKFRPLREVLFQMVQATDEPAPTPPQTLH